MWVVGKAAGTAHSIALSMQDPCQQAKLVGMALRAFEATQAIGSAASAYQEFMKEGFTLQFAMNVVASVMSLSAMAKACFAAGTPIRTPSGSKLIERIGAGDEILCRDENDPEGRETVISVVEEVFRTESPVIDVIVEGRAIRTTGQHPFYVVGKGWTEAAALVAGDALLSDNGKPVIVSKVIDTGRFERVWNFRVKDHHTYFVGGDDWGWECLAHNAKCLPIGHSPIRKEHGGGEHNSVVVYLGLQALQYAKAGMVRTNQALVDAYGNTLSLLRPDVQHVDGFGNIHITEIWSFRTQYTEHLNRIREAYYKQLLGSSFGSYDGIFLR
jgi:hypothetical protein